VQAMSRNVLVIGGTSGLGLKIALLLSQNSKVFVTGRKMLNAYHHLTFIPLDIGPDSNKLGDDLDEVLESIPDPIHLLVYAAGFYQDGNIAHLSDKDIDTMNNVGLAGAEKLLARIIRRQAQLDGLILVTSTSEWTPRPYESAYTGAKAGLAMFGKSVGSSLQIRRVLTVAPAGMDSGFWDGIDMDTSTMLDPGEVARETLRLYKLDLPYTIAHARILREPARVEIDHMVYTL